MKSAAFLNYTDIPITLIGLAIFITIFIGSVIWVNIKGNSLRYRKIAEQILDEGEQV